jgi:hypothetical protein
MSAGGSLWFWRGLYNLRRCAGLVMTSTFSHPILTTMKLWLGWGTRVHR